MVESLGSSHTIPSYISHKVWSTAYCQLKVERLKEATKRFRESLDWMDFAHEAQCRPTQAKEQAGSMGEDGRDEPVRFNPKWRIGI
jgi:hypothetical protein